MTDPDRLRLRLLALLHQPPELALLPHPLARADRDAAAAEHQQALGLNEPNADENARLATADHIASGANEYNLPPGQGFNPDFERHPVIRHPLSGAEVDLPGAVGKNAAALTADVRAALTELSNRGLSEEQQALALWRDLPDRLARAHGPFWAALPSDARIPDHAVWDHLALTAALTTAGIGKKGDVSSSTAALLLFTLGPVQSFIAAARKTADLWASSYLLSFLTWRAIRVVADALGPEAVLFPDLRRQPLVDRWLTGEKKLTLTAPAENYRAATLPNRFFAVVPDAEADRLAHDACLAVRQTLGEMAGFALDALPKKKTGDDCFARAQAIQQAEAFPEVFWAVLPFQRFEAAGAGADAFRNAFEATYPDFFDWDDGDANSILTAFHTHNKTTNAGTVYGRLFRVVDGLVGGRKALRDFGGREESGYRCSLLRELPAVVPLTGNGDAPRTGEVGDFWDRAAARLPKSKLRPGERLSPVALARRYLPEWLRDEEKLGAVEAAFPSTSSLAAADFKQDVVRRILEKDEGHVALGAALAVFQARLNVLADMLGENVGPRGPFVETPLRALEDALDGKEDAEGLLTWLARLDGTWLYAEGYEEKSVAREYVDRKAGTLSKPAQRTALDAAQKAFGEFLDAAKEASVERPSKYYAVLMLDGDEMGKWLSGERAPRFREMLHPHVLEEFAARVGAETDAERYGAWQTLLATEDLKRPQSPALHLAISRALGTFGLDLVPRLTEQEHLGRLVYGGGDDVLALFSLRAAVPAAHALRAAFSGQVRDDDEELPLTVAWGKTSGYVTLDGVPRLTMGHTASASAGLVFAHHRQSLQQVLARAREAEKYAKDTLGRDALALCVVKRSGETIRSGIKWTSDPDTDARAVDLVEALGGYADLIRHGLVATGLVHDLDAERAGLEGLAAVARQSDDPARARSALDGLRAECRRLFLRRAEKLDAPADEFERTVGCLLDHSGRDAEDAAGTVPHLERLVGLLDVAQFLGQGGER